jgi:hypothetical protein
MGMFLSRSKVRFRLARSGAAADYVAEENPIRGRRLFRITTRKPLIDSLVKGNCAPNVENVT